MTEGGAMPVVDVSGAESAQKKKKAAAAHVLMVSVLLNVMCQCVLFPIRPALVSELVQDQAAVSMALARLTSVSALSEFLVNPIFGRLSDRYGRKPFLVGALCTSALANLTLSLRRPSMRWMFFERCTTVAADTVFFTNARAALTDFLSGADLTLSASRVALAAGIGVLMGPLVSVRLLQNRYRLCYGANAAILTSTAAYVAAVLPETLAVERQLPMDFTRANPLSFVRLLFASPTVFRLMLCSWLQTLIDGRNIVESNFMYMRDQLGFSQLDLGNYMMFGGVKVFIGGAMGKPLMQRFGQLGMTTVSNAINFVAQILGMTASGTLGIYVHVLVTGLGERKRDGVETLISSEAATMGFGRGETAAGAANFRSVANIVAPLLFAASYNWGITKPRDFPKAVFLTRMVVGSVLPELCLRAIRPEERKRLVNA